VTITQRQAGFFRRVRSLLLLIPVQGRDLLLGPSSRTSQRSRIRAALAPAVPIGRSALMKAFLLSLGEPFSGLESTSFGHCTRLRWDSSDIPRRQEQITIDKGSLCLFDGSC